MQISQMKLSEAFSMLYVTLCVLKYRSIINQMAGFAMNKFLASRQKHANVLAGFQHLDASSSKSSHVLKL